MSRHKQRFYAAILFAVCGSSAGLAQMPAAAKKAGNEGRAGLVEYLDHMAAMDTADRRAKVSAINTRQAAEQRQAEVRSKVLKLLGPLPERTPLNAKTMGVTQADGFRIEKVIFDSQPGFHVPALLYLPDGRQGELPAVLIAPGHGATGKASDYQTAATFARNGFAVLSYDPIGQGERLQYPDPAHANASLAARPTGEHGEASLQPTLIGDAVALYFVWDAMRAIDYLVQRPEIDPKRIGAFGCSGGGAMTALTAALDTRVAAAGVACYNTSYDTILPAIGPQDGEQSIPGFVASGFDFPDWIELVAPRPYAAIATYSDMFPFAGAFATVSEARRFYSLFDRSSMGTPSGRNAADPATLIKPALNADSSNDVPLTAPLQFITGPGGHGALAPILSEIVAFFLRNLQPGADAAHPFLMPRPAAGAGNGLPTDALQVTATGQVSTSYPGAATVFSLNKARAAKVITPKMEGPGLADAVRRVTNAMAKPGQKAYPSDNQQSGRIALDSSESPASLQGNIAVPEGKGRHPAVLMLVPNSILGDNDIARANKVQFDRLAAAGNVVLALTPVPSPPGTDDMKAPILGPFYLLSLRAQITGETLLGLRVNDAIRAVDYLQSRHDVDPSRIAAIGDGHMGLVLLHATVLDARLKHITIAHTLLSYRSLIDAPLPTGAPEDILPGVLRAYDLPDLVKALGPRLTATEPLKGTEDLSQASTPLKSLEPVK